MARKVEEKRRFLRLTTPLELSYILSGDDRVYKAVTKDLSALGLRFVSQKELQPETTVDITLYIPNLKNPIHVTGKVVWQRRQSLEDNAPYDIGVEFVQIEEDNKNTFLKYLCDLIYG